GFVTPCGQKAALGQRGTGFTMAFVVLVCLFLLAVAMRCAKLVVDPYSTFSASTWEEEAKFIKQGFKQAKQ
uniref:Cortexin 1 n=1 Tax=Anas platyrhynchos platyrhynchos TaxID=8840 RepID=A0A493T477_ANAPP